MAWQRGLELLADTRTGRAMIGGSVATSVGTALVAHRKVHVSGRTSLALGAALAAAQLAAVAYLGHRLVRAGEELAVKAVFGEEEEPALSDA